MLQSYTQFLSKLLFISSFSLGVFAYAQPTKQQPTEKPQSTPPVQTTTTTSTTAMPEKKSKDEPPPTNSSAPAVSDAYQLGHEDKKDEKRNNVTVGQVIIVKVDNLKTLVNQSNCRDESGKTGNGCTQQDIALFLDHRKLKGIAPEVIDETNNLLQFHLKHSADTAEAWSDLLGAADWKNATDFYQRAVEVSVGLENGSPIPTTVKGELFKINRGSQNLFWGSTVCFLILLILTIWLARSSDILRDAGPQPDPNDRSKRKPYSLARCQMALWFFLIVASFISILIVTSAQDTITSGVLALMGIGAGTALGAAIIDVSKTNIAAENVGRLSEGFLKDLLTDANGYSFHRFQMFVWTIVLAGMFIYSVWSRLAMPDFSATLLALQGISAGTYLGFKIPEQH